MKFWLAGLVLGAAALAAGCSQAPAAASPPAATPVVVATAQRRDVRLTTEWVATLDGYVNANIQPQVSGYLVRQDYREGAEVHKGQVLFEIDPRPFQAALDQAKGQLAQARGQLAQAQAQVAVAEAQLGTNRLNVARDRPEAEAHAIPESQLQNDTQAMLAAQAALAAAHAAVQTEQAAVEAASAAVEQASLNLGFTQVRSLLDGVAGIAQVQIGNLVTPQTVLTAVSQLNPIKAYFPIRAQDYLRSVTHRDGAVDLLRESGAPLELVLADGSTYGYRGRVLFADRQVDAATGTLRIAAAFPNPGNLLRPGQYGRVRAVTQIAQGAVLVPQSAVIQLQGGYQVAVVGPDDRVAIRNVAVGATLGADWIITRGLQAGERVVAQGTDKVRDGSRVRPVAAPAGDTLPASGSAAAPAPASNAAGGGER